ncbi:MAG: DUF2177 family protein [Chloroflexota bacterium]
MSLKLYFLTLVVFLGIDSVWLGLVAPKFYRSQIGHLMAEKANLLVAGLFYLLFVGVLVYFVVAPAVPSGEMRNALLRGALFGLVTYATYDLTNHATLRDWSSLVTVVDMIWGTLLTAATSALSVWAARMFGF